MRTFEPGLCSVTFRSLSANAIIDLAANNGIKAIEWGGDTHVTPGDLKTARAVAIKTADAGITISSYGSYIFAPDFKPAELTAVLETAEALGAGHIRIWPGSKQRPSRDYSAGERGIVVVSLADIAEKADRHGISIGLEYHPNSLTDTLQSSLQLKDEVSSPNLFFYWQPAPGLPLEKALEEIAMIGNRICHLHVFAWEADAKRLALEDRAAYWRACLNALPASEWEKESYAMLEFVKDDSVTQFAADAETIKQTTRQK